MRFFTTTCRRLFIFLITALIVSICLPALAQQNDYTSLRKQYSTLATTGGTRGAHTALGNQFYLLYNSDPSAQNADNALLFAGKSYKLSYEKFSQKADLEAAQRYLVATSNNSTSDAGAEALLELAETYAMKQDYASAQFTLNKVKTRYSGSVQEMAADGMLSDLQIMAIKSGTGQGLNAPATPVVEAQTHVEPPVDTSNDSDNDNNVGIDSFVPMDSNAPIPEGTAQIKNIRYFSASDYTRIVIDLSQPASFEKYWLRENPDQKMPPRLFIDVDNSVVDKKVSTNMNIKDGLVNRVRWGYNKPGVTRIVLDSDSIQNFTVFQMANPARIVVDVSKNDKFQNAQSVNSTPPPPGVVNVASNTKTPSGRSANRDNSTLIGVFGLKVNTVVIDAGHGGKDPGCMYFGVKEKDLVLDIAKNLRDLLKANTKLNVYMTRDTDKYIPLEERTAIANKLKADLFVSIHINATRNGKASGIETYTLNITNDKNALEVAAFENQATTKSISDLQGILKDIMQSSKLEESSLLANVTQQGIIVATKASSKQNLGIKQAPFYVLVGANMPAVLAEVGFLSNKDDADKLKNSAYRKQVAQGLYTGIMAYVDKYNK